MSTRSAIGFKSKDGKILASYCHFDGMPSHVGHLVKTCYNTKKKILELINLGSIRVLKSTIETTEFFSRDCEESFEGNEPLIFDRLELISPTMNSDYVYILDEVTKVISTYKY